MPIRTTLKQMVRRFKSRWRIERSYQDLKGELGLNHYEGRSFVGWNHHVSVVLACYAFLVAEHMRSFPPRPEARAQTVRSHTRPERHFHDSLVTLRVILVRELLVRWLPRCPCCLRPFEDVPPRAASCQSPVPPTRTHARVPQAHGVSGRSRV